MLQRLYIHNFKTFQNFELKPEGRHSSLLLGKNGAGKSSVAHALRVLQSVGRGVNRVGQLVTPRHFFGGHTAAPMRLEVDVVLQGQNFRYNLALELPEKFKELRVLEERLECEGHTVYERAQAQVSLRKVVKRFDDTEAAAAAGLTTIRQPAAAKGRVAVEATIVPIMPLSYSSSAAPWSSTSMSCMNVPIRPVTLPGMPNSHR